jgi:multicomponent K+:H+ antiporter subunit E
MMASPSLTSKWFPRPVLSVLLGVSWLLLSHSLALVHLLSAVLIGVIVPRMVSPFLGDAVRVDWWAAFKLFWVVLKDIVMSNITVARITLGSMDVPQPMWLRVPLDTQNGRLNALFASIITTTPGTVSATVDEAKHCIWVHALTCDDPEAMIQDMKARYEQPLKNVFRLSTEGTQA